ncbi:MAG: ribosome recycling factor [Candidatus Parcubacteria bacterium]|nr:ribosome recycling factor [Candidatus Parcubacteria bacterium]
MAYDFNPYKKQLAGVEEWLKREFMQVRTGQASPSVLDSVRVEIYGAPLAIKELGAVTIEGARTLRIAPWDKSQAKDIEKAISVANLGVSVMTDDQGLRVIFPELTADRRRVIAKQAKDRLEEAKKQIRQHLDAVINDIQAKEKAGGYCKDDIFRLKNETQKYTDEEVKKIDGLYEKKEKEILT